MKAAGLHGRVFPAVGNHEVWDDSDVEGLLAFFPYLRKLGVSERDLIYKFDYQGTRFIFLWTGNTTTARRRRGTPPGRPTKSRWSNCSGGWTKPRPNGTKTIFISFHTPAFCRSGMGAIPEAQNPHTSLPRTPRTSTSSSSTDTCTPPSSYHVDGVKYLLLGGGGAEQDPILPGRTHLKVPDGYPPDQYWKGGARARSTTTSS